MIDYINYGLLRAMTPQLSIYDEIIAPFISSGLSFVYIRLFPEGYYYILADGGHKFLNEYVQLKKATLFCKREFTGCSDKKYRFLEWPDVPSTECMHKYFDNGRWYGVTVLKQCDHYLEACGITCDIANNKQEVLSRDKYFIMTCRQYVLDNVVVRLNPPTRFSTQDLFRFPEGYSVDIDSAKVDAENQLLENIRKEIVRPDIVYTPRQ